MDGPAPYFQWGFIQISLPNLVVIAVMLLLFVLALVLPFPGHAGPHDKGGHRDERAEPPTPRRRDDA